VYGVDEKVRAEIAVKNRLRACFSPFAQQPGHHTIDEVLAGEIVSDPLRFLECCAMSVGSSAALLCSEELAYQLTDSLSGSTSRADRTRSAPATAGRCEIPLLPNETEEGYAWLYEEMETGRPLARLRKLRRHPFRRVHGVPHGRRPRIRSRISISSRPTTRSRSRIFRPMATSA
jgi:acetyl-CoA acetyltransferase